MAKFEFTVNMIKKYKVMINPSFHMCQRYAERILDKGEKYSEEFVKTNYNFVYGKLMKDYFDSKPIFYGRLEKEKDGEYIYSLNRDILFVAGHNGTGVTIYKINVDDVKKIPLLLTHVNAMYSEMARLSKIHEEANKIARHYEWYVKKLRADINNQTEPLLKEYLHKELEQAESTYEEKIEFGRKAVSAVVDGVEEIREVVNLLVNKKLNIGEYLNQAKNKL